MHLCIIHRPTLGPDLKGKFNVSCVIQKHDGHALQQFI